MRLCLWSVALVLLLIAPAAASASPTRYVPRSGDYFDYHETTQLTGGVGNYTGYTETGTYDGSIHVTAIQPNGTESASYQASGNWMNNQGQSQPWSESGSFTFSATTFRYVQGTDNQTGYVNPYVWFYADNSLAQGSTFYLLNTQMKLVSTNSSVALPMASTGYAQSLLTEGNGSYQRADVYGTFSATYQWVANFDPATGYILGYTYMEQDRDASGNGFTWTDQLYDTQASFPVVAAAPPPSAPASFPTLAVAGLLVAILVVLLVVILLTRARRARAGLQAGGLPRHAPPVGTDGPPLYAPPPPVDLIPRDQPPVQQVVLRETVRVPCRFCGTLIDSTATVCPKCGAPRT